MTEEWEDNPFAVLADVVCTWDGEEYSNELCYDHAIQNILEFKYGDPLALEPVRLYDWDTSSITYDTLSEFMQTHLKPLCTLTKESLPNCNRSELQQLQVFLDMSIEELDEAISAEDKKLWRVLDVEQEINDIKKTVAEIHNVYLSEKNKVADEVKITTDVIKYFLQRKAAEEMSDDDLESICVAIGTSECDEDVEKIVESTRGMDTGTMRAMLDEQNTKLESSLINFDEQVDVLMGTSEKLQTDLVDEASYLYDNAKATGYYLMKATRDTKILLMNKACTTTK